jgi:hypothetical protein
LHKFAFLAFLCAGAMIAPPPAPSASMVRFDVKAIDNAADPAKISTNTPAATG